MAGSKTDSTLPRVGWQPGPDDEGLRSTNRFAVELPEWFARERVLRYLGRDPESVTERVEGSLFSFGSRLDDRPLAVHVDLADDMAHCRVERDGCAVGGDLEAICTQVRRYLGLVIDPRPFERRAAQDEVVRRLVAGRAGLSIPQTANLFDAFVWVVVGQQVSLAVAFALRRRLSRVAGVQVAEGLFAPPRPKDVAALEHDDLRGLSFSRRKAEYLLDIARAVVGGSFDLLDLQELSPAELEQRLLAVRGLGPWSANYLMMRSLGLVDCVPVGDVALMRNLQRFFDLDSRPDADATRRLMAPFAPHRSLATFHFWALHDEAQ